MAKAKSRQSGLATSDNTNSHMYTWANHDWAIVCKIMVEDTASEKSWLGRLVDGVGDCMWHIANVWVA
jgi:hypothetical protein